MSAVSAQRFFEIKDCADDNNHTDNEYVAQWDESEELNGAEFSLEWGLGNRLFFDNGYVRVLAADSNTMKITVFGPRGVGDDCKENPLLTIDLQVGRHPGDPTARHWFLGSYMVSSEVVGHVYLFQRDCKKSSEGYYRRIYIELIDVPGPHAAHRPELGKLIKDTEGPGFRKKSSPADSGMFARRRIPGDGDDLSGDYVQDDVGTGYERKPT